MATTTTFPKPRWALQIWYDANNIYLELPTADGIGYMVKYPFSEAGLSKALNVMKFTHDQCHRKNGTKTKVGDKPSTPVKRVGRQPVQATDEQRESVRALLRKRGLV